jgi:hypothetical protein
MFSFTPPHDASALVPRPRTFSRPYELACCACSYFNQSAETLLKLRESLKPLNVEHVYSLRSLQAAEGGLI